MVEVLDPIVLQTSPLIEMDDEQFFQFCRINGDYRIERSPDGSILVTYPKAWQIGAAGAAITRYFSEWCDQDGSGRAFACGGFTLPNGAVRGPDIAWILESRIKTISRIEWERFPRICPDFVLELHSPGDRLSTLQAKMQEYIASGARLGWLIDPESRTVHIYRPNSAPEILVNSCEIVGESVLLNFRLCLKRIWQAMEF